MELPPKGPLQEVGFIQLILDSMGAKLTGMIRLEDGSIIKVVYLQQGNVAFASSNEKTDRLTEVLKRAGKLTPEQIEHAQARLRPNVSLGKTLVELGYINPKDLLWGARMQVESILHQLLFWTQGNYQVIEGPLPKEIVSLNMPVPQIVFDGILKTRDRDWVLQHIGSPQSVFQLDSSFHERNALYKLPVDDTVSRMNGKRSLEEIAQASGQDTFEVCKAVTALYILDMVQKAPGKAAAPEAPIVVPEMAREPIAAVPELTPVMPKQDLSLGEVMHIPTVAQLQQANKEEAAAQMEPEPPFEPTIVFPPAKTEPAPLIFDTTPEPPRISVEPETEPQQPVQEEEDTETLKETAKPEKPTPKPWQPPASPPAHKPPATLRITPEPSQPYSSPPVSDPDRPAFPMESMSLPKRKSKRPGYSAAINWRKIALIMGVITVAVIAVTLLYTQYFQKPPAREYPTLSPSKALGRPAPATQPAPPVTVEPAPPVATKKAPDQSKTPLPATPAQKPPVSAAPPPATKPAPVTVAASGPLGLLKSGRTMEAANSWRKALLPKRSRYTVQLEIACQESTIMEAFQMLNDSPELAVVPLDYHGKACYRVLYGVYPTAEEAQAKRSRLPQDFLKQDSPAQVIPLTKALK